MSEDSSHPRALHLIIEGFPEEKLAELTAPNADANTEIFRLTEANAREALKKIFAADHVAVWGKL